MVAVVRVSEHQHQVYRWDGTSRNGSRCATMQCKLFICHIYRWRQHIAAVRRKPFISKKTASFSGTLVITAWPPRMYAVNHQTISDGIFLRELGELCETICLKIQIVEVQNAIWSQRVATWGCRVYAEQTIFNSFHPGKSFCPCKLPHCAVQPSHCNTSQPARTTRWHLQLTEVNSAELSPPCRICSGITR